MKNQIATNATCGVTSLTQGTTTATFGGSTIATSKGAKTVTRVILGVNNAAQGAISVDKVLGGIKL